MIVLYICIKQRGNSPLIKNLTTMKTIFTVNEVGYTDSVSVFESENEFEARDFFEKRRKALSTAEPVDVSEWADNDAGWRDIYRVELEKMITKDDGYLIDAEQLDTTPYYYN